MKDRAGEGERGRKRLPACFGGSVLPEPDPIGLFYSITNQFFVFLEEKSNRQVLNIRHKGHKDKK
ncbi:MAG: hypothetical protein DRQ24_06450 [Candidatus Latescibacterota bacterium]|nr:MAG: hypothetical protein DRQ24_06450 [Candidatus Latescibacterota bacterium]